MSPISADKAHATEIRRRQLRRCQRRQRGVGEGRDPSRRHRAILLALSAANCVVESAAAWLAVSRLASTSTNALIFVDGREPSIVRCQAGELGFGEASLCRTSRVELLRRQVGMLGGRERAALIWSSKKCKPMVAKT
ncbi:MAG: hypothetical protein IPO30_16245 [Hyphomonadaceae bacterium]|nr:hypothetical protein [Hyphomonadaceae bacterium]